MALLQETSKSDREVAASEAARETPRQTGERASLELGDGLGLETEVQGTRPSATAKANQMPETIHEGLYRHGECRPGSPLRTQSGKHLSEEKPSTCLQHDSGALYTIPPHVLNDSHHLLQL